MSNAPDGHYNDLDVEVRRITVTASFDAYVVAGASDDRIGWEVADAIAMRAPHLSSTEETDGLVAIIGGGSPDAVHILDVSVDGTPADVEVLPVAEEVERTEAWL